MSNSNIKCSVVMAAYNAENTIETAINSILNQTWENFEFIIINDGSTDKTQEIIESYKDSRIKLINNINNEFLPACLNKGISASTGKYILRMDADDISLPDRMDKQVAYMEKYPNIGIAGSWFKIFGNKNSTAQYVENSDEIKIKLLYECHLLHPAIIIRKEIIDTYNLFYDETFRKNQDYELFIRAADYTDFGNVQEILFEYCQTDQNEKRNTLNQVNNILNLQKDLFSKLGYSINDEQLSLFKELNYQNYLSISDKSIEIHSLLEKLLEANKVSQFFNQLKFDEYIKNLWLSFARNIVKYNAQVIETTKNSTMNFSRLELIYFTNLLKLKRILK
jgi:glycosyltransferase involved in cell wall biosynthesis